MTTMVAKVQILQPRPSASTTIINNVVITTNFSTTTMVVEVTLGQNYKIWSFDPSGQKMQIKAKVAKIFIFVFLKIFRNFKIKQYRENYKKLIY